MDSLTVQVRRNQTTHRAMLHVSPVLCIFRDSRAHTASMSSDLCNMAQEKVRNGSLRLGTQADAKSVPGKIMLVFVLDLHVFKNIL